MMAVSVEDFCSGKLHAVLSALSRLSRRNSSASGESRLEDVFEGVTDEVYLCLFGVVTQPDKAATID